MAFYRDETYIGERALFALRDSQLDNCTFKDGESPLKESRNLTIRNCNFMWKYPIWYSENVDVDHSRIAFTARSGIWDSKRITMRNTLIEAPKTFRRSEYIDLDYCDMPNALETLWNCNHVKINKMHAKGDYFGMNSENIEIDNFYLDGNYCFDGGKNIVIKNSTLYSKDSFWNSENVTCINCVIVGEYLAWNSKNLTFINCTIESHQGLCYIDGLKMINCKMINSDLCFECCSNIDVELIESIDSIKNPYSGRIRAKGIKTLIMDEKYIDPSLTTITIE